MKTIVIGDIHGRNIWKKIVEHENADRIIFVGDYFDSFDIPRSDQINNFLDIIEYKKSSGKEVILLIGNHDYHYIKGITEIYSGYDSVYRFQIEYLLDHNKHHLQIAYQDGEFLFTHAGVSSVFLDEVLGKDWLVESLADKLNELFQYKPLYFGFYGKDYYGDDIEQTPIWIRPRSLMKANKRTLNKKVIQVVGHTGQERIDILGKSTGGRYYFIDCLESSGEYLIIEDGIITSNSHKNY